MEKSDIQSSNSDDLSVELLKYIDIDSRKKEVSSKDGSRENS